MDGFVRAFVGEAKGDTHHIPSHLVLSLLMVNPALHPVHMAVPCLGQAVPVVDAPLSHLHMLTGTHTHRQTTHTHTHTHTHG